MRKLLLGLTLALLASAAQAQTCPNQPLGNSTNACANTRFVIQNAGGGGSSNIVIGTTTVTGGTSTRVLYDNAGLVGEYAISGTGSVAMTVSPAFTTPNLGAAIGTSASLSSFASLGTASSATGQLRLAHASSSFLTTITAGNALAARTWTWPTDFGSSGCVLTDAVGNGALSCATPAAGGVTSVALSMPGIFSVTGSPITTSGTFSVAALGTSGGIPYFNSGTTLDSSGALTANLPMIGGGAGAAPSVGSRSGNTTAFVTTTGAQTSGNCVSIDASGNHVAAGAACASITFTASSTDTLTNKTYDTAGAGNVFKINGTTINAIGGNTSKVGTTSGVLTSGDCVSIDANGNFVAAGGACTTGGGGGTVNAGVAGELAYYGSTGTAVTGNANHTLSTGTMIHGIAGSVVGASRYANATSGSITVSPPAGALGTINLIWPAANDTLVGKATTDIFTNKTYDTAGTGNSFSINGLAATANTGTGAVVRANTPSLTTPAIGAATGTSLALGGGTALTTTNQTGTGSLVLATSPTLAGTPLAPTAAAATNTTQIATTAFVQTAVGALSFGTVVNLAARGGGFDVWNRNTTVTQAASLTAYANDGWYLITNANQASTIVRDAGIATGSTYAATVVRNAGQTGTGVVRYSMPLDLDELAPMQSGYVALSFTVKTGANWSPTSGTLAYTLYCGTGSVAKRGASSYTGETTPISGTTALTPGGAAIRVTATSGSTVGATCTQAEIQFAWTPVGTAGANDSIAFDSLQLEVVSSSASVASAFVPLLFEKQYNLASRFFQKSTAYATAISTSADSSYQSCVIFSTTIANGSNYCVIFYPTKFRSTPTVVIYPYTTPANTNRISNSAGTDFGASSGVQNGGNENHFLVVNSSGGALTVASQQVLFGWYASAEI